MLDAEEMVLRVVKITCTANHGFLAIQLCGEDQNKG